MKLFGLGPCAEVGKLKSAVKDAILDGLIPNEHDAALQYIMEQAAGMGIKPKAE
jgi:poly(A) polymerase